MTDKKHDTLTGHDFRADKPLSRQRAMREKCLECQAGSKDRVKTCPMYDCALWPYRLGKGITQSEDGEKVVTRRMTAENRAKAAERMKNIRKKKTA